MGSSVSTLATGIGDGLLRASMLGAEPPLVDGRYSLLKTLGQGASGVVVLATDQRLQRQVALKLAPVVGGAPIMLEEGRALAALQRPPNVVQVYEVGEGVLQSSTLHERVYFLAMEFIDGMPLRGWLEVRGAPPAEVLQAYAGVAKGLAFVHERGIVHGDMKADNVAMGKDNVPIVIDFGFTARLHEKRDSITRQEAVGTGPYMAPEAHRGEASPKGDVYAFAVSLWESLTRELPFEDDTPKLGWFGGIKNLRNAKKVPPRVRKVLRKAMHPRPTERPSMEVVAETVGRAASKLSRRRSFFIVRALVLSLFVISALGLGWLGIAAMAKPGRSPMWTGSVDPDPLPNSYQSYPPALPRPTHAIPSVSGFDRAAVDSARAAVQQLQVAWNARDLNSFVGRYAEHVCFYRAHRWTRHRLRRVFSSNFEQAWPGAMNAEVEFRPASSAPGRLVFRLFGSVDKTDGRVLRMDKWVRVQRQNGRWVVTHEKVFGDRSGCWETPFVP